jgi:hypothetical protein
VGRRAIRSYWRRHKRRHRLYGASLRGSYIIQSAAAKRPHIVEYAVAHKLAEGVYQVIAIDEDDAKGATRARNCKRANDSHCRVVTPKQLFVFARATAARHKGEGGLVLRLANDDSEPRR